MTKGKAEFLLRELAESAVSALEDSTRDETLIRLFKEDLEVIVQDMVDDLEWPEEG